MTLRRSIEHHLNAIWYGTRRPPLLLRILSRLHGLWRQKKAPIQKGRTQIPVIVVGNLVVGGSGKTPVVRALNQAIQSQGYDVVVIARGYGAKGLGQSPIRVDPQDLAHRVGDEPLMLAQQLGTKVVVCTDRSRGLDEAICWGAEVVISDDGLQSPKLDRSYEVCVIDGVRGFGNGSLLPAGPLRSEVETLNACDLVLVKEGDFIPTVPFERFALTAVALRVLDMGVSYPAEHFAGQVVTALCGIAHPDAFEKTLDKLGMKPVLKAFPDHHRFCEQDLAGIDARHPIVVTEKDAVKLEALALTPEQKGRIYVLIVDAKLSKQAIDPVLLHIKNFYE